MKNKETKATKAAFNSYLEPGVDNKWREDNAYRKAHKGWLKKSARIAIKLNRYLKNNSIRQNDLAKKMEVSPQQINKILKGRENLTLDTIDKLERVLGIDLIHVLKHDEMVIQDPLADMIYAESFALAYEMDYEEIINEETATLEYTAPLRVAYRSEKTAVAAKPSKRSLEFQTSITA